MIKIRVSIRTNFPKFSNFLVFEISFKALTSNEIHIFKSKFSMKSVFGRSIFSFLG